MKLLVLCNEPPYPPVHGGRADVWRRLVAMRHHGASLMLVFWAADIDAERPSPDSMAVMRGIADDVHWCVIERTLAPRLRRLWLLHKHHSHVVSRLLDARARNQLLEKARAYAPDAIWLENIQAGPTALDLAQTLNVPLYVRSANVEHVYAGKQAQRALSRGTRLRWARNLDHLKALEFQTLSSAKRFFDISAHDMQWWAEQGVTNGSWLPSLVEDDFASRLSAPLQDGEQSHDVGYLGNLFTPNNVEGLLWYLQRVVPLLKAARPGIRIFIAGSRPSPVIQEAAASAGVDLIANPPDAVTVLRKARVLVNPVFAGSGVNIKSIDMLFSPAHLVSTRQGLAGLPHDVTRFFQVAEEPQPFAAAILRQLDTADSAQSAERVSAQALFQSSAIRQVLNLMNESTTASPLPVDSTA